ncbi:DivIVA domain-containing protein [Actinopolymorpha singaporensis]|uniref:DivIVA domain-containing protein n=1 Tax=Actinopolymorpha singaporensis TaxID=117157 RepID=A0A1H1YUL2_9ACTN|nr:DivIVA domain-containing protein [Actinopolymorpha singaporensis]SDT24979.1 DivIVA domain-containing protein [Actinopolymorpha singaporensis]
MTWLWVVLVLVVLGSTAAVAVGRGGAMARAYPDRREVRLPADRPVSASDLDDLRFSVVLRGYRMDEVDDVIARIGRDLAEREERVAVREREVAERESRQPDRAADRAETADRAAVEHRVPGEGHGAGER